MTHGTIDSPKSGIAGREITLTVTPELGYKLTTGTLKYNGTSIDDTYTFDMPAANVTISAQFELRTYDVEVDDDMIDGTLEASPESGNMGIPITLEVKPDSGYGLKPGTLKYNDGTTDTLIDETSLTFTMPASNVTVSAEFGPLYTVTIDSGIAPNTITPDLVEAVEGTEISLTVTPDPAYGLKPGTLKYNNGTTDTLIDATSLTFTMPASNVTVSAEFGLLYNVTIAGGSIPNGTVTPSPVKAVEGTEIILTVTPDPGYGLEAGSLKYSDDGVNYTPINETTRKFTMPAADVTVSAVFEAQPYTVTISDSMINGTITLGPGSTTTGALITLTAVPATGYWLKAGTFKVVKTADNSLVSGTPSGNTYTFTMPAADVTVNAQFEPYYTVTINGGILPIPNGTVTSIPVNAVEGTLISLTVTPNLDYRLKTETFKVVTADNSPVSGSLSGNTYSFTMPASNVAVSAEFERVYTIAGGGSIPHGTVTSTPESGPEGTSITLTAVPDDGYRLKAGTFPVVKTVGDSPVSVTGSDNPYTFTMPAANVTVSAEFETIPGRIHDAVDLSKIGTTAYYPMDGDYELKNDITLPAGWTPIGSGTTPFTGNFDGKGHRITINSFPSAGVDISSAFPDINGGVTARGLFAYTKNNEIKELNITVNLGSTFVISSSTAMELFGTVAAAAVDTTFTKIKISGELDVDASSTTAKLMLGGIVGASLEESSITGCSMSGDVEVSGGNDTATIGGLSGSAQGTIENSFVSGNVSVTSTAKIEVGGLTGNIGSGNDPITSTIQKSYSTGTVDAISTAGTASAGGIAGNNGGGGELCEITDCYSTANVSADGVGKADAGGIMARMNSNNNSTVTITHCYASGNISVGNSASDRNAGGIVGGGSFSITACAALSGSVDSSGGTARRILAIMGGYSLHNNIALDSMLVNDAAINEGDADTHDGINGLSKDSTELADQSTYTTTSPVLGWDFGATWKMQGGRPVLQWQP